MPQKHSARCAIRDSERASSGGRVCSSPACVTEHTCGAQATQVLGPGPRLDAAAAAAPHARSLSPPLALPHCDVPLAHHTARQTPNSHQAHQHQPPPPAASTPKLSDAWETTAGTNSLKPQTGRVVAWTCSPHLSTLTAYTLGRLRLSAPQPPPPRRSSPLASTLRLPNSGRARCSRPTADTLVARLHSQMGLPPSLIPLPASTQPASALRASSGPRRYSHQSSARQSSRTSPPPAPCARGSASAGQGPRRPSTGSRAP